MSRRAIAVLVVVLLVSLFGADAAQVRLESIQPDRKRFLELLYVPRGRAMDILSFGFRAPLADLLWLRGLLYYSDNVRAAARQTLKADATLEESLGQAKYRYVIDLHRLISRLQPRFIRANLYGGLFLFSTGNERAIREGLALMDEGVAAIEKAAAAGEPILPDERWRLRVQQATAWEMTLLSLASARGDLEGAREAHAQAIARLAEAVRLPGCPESILTAWATTERDRMTGQGPIDRYDAMIATWQSLLEEKSANRDLEKRALAELDRLLDRRSRLSATAEAERFLTDIARRFAADRKRPPGRAEELVEAGLLTALPPLPLSGQEEFGGGPDLWRVLPEGTVRSQLAARAEARFLAEKTEQAAYAFYLAHAKRYPARLSMLVSDGFLDALPAHPLASLGYRFTYFPVKGVVGEEEPEN